MLYKIIKYTFYYMYLFLNVTLDYKTNHKGTFFENEIYTTSQAE